MVNLFGIREMQPITFEVWSNKVDSVVVRLENILDAFDEGEAIVTVPNSEVRALDLIGLELLRKHVPDESPLVREWYVHEETSNLAVDASIRYLRSNQGKLRALQSFPDGNGVRSPS